LEGCGYVYASAKQFFYLETTFLRTAVHMNKQNLTI